MPGKLPIRVYLLVDSLALLSNGLFSSGQVFLHRAGGFKCLKYSSLFILLNWLSSVKYTNYFAKLDRVKFKMFHLKIFIYQFKRITPAKMLNNQASSFSSYWNRVQTHIWICISILWCTWRVKDFNSWMVQPFCGKICGIRLFRCS